MESQRVGYYLEPMHMRLSVCVYTGKLAPFIHCKLELLFLFSFVFEIANGTFYVFLNTVLGYEYTNLFLCGF